jgi:hypothetical protein
MKRKRARSRGVRNPARNAFLFGLVSIASIALVVLGFAEADHTGSPLVMLGIFPALLCPIFFFHYLRNIRVFRDMRSGQSAIARWTVPAEQFSRFCEVERRIPARSIMANFYKPPDATPVGGVEVIFAGDGVLIGDGYFPLSTTGGRRLQSVRYIASDPPSIEFGTVMKTMVRTSSATIETFPTAETLRVPVAADAASQAGEVVRRYQANIDRR